MMNTLAKLIAAGAALIASFAFAWIAQHGITVNHAGDVGLGGALKPVPIQLRHEGSVYLSHDGSVNLDLSGAVGRY